MFSCFLRRTYLHSQAGNSTSPKHLAACRCRRRACDEVPCVLPRHGAYVLVRAGSHREPESLIPVTQQGPSWLFAARANAEGEGEPFLSAYHFPSRDGVLDPTAPMVRWANLGPPWPVCCSPVSSLYRPGLL